MRNGCCRFDSTERIEYVKGRCRGVEGCNSVPKCCVPHYVRKQGVPESSSRIMSLLSALMREGNETNVISTAHQI
jgi:hypothetical protein